MLTLSACAYRIDIRQGNYVEKRDVAKLRQNMTPEQVTYILGTPLLKDSFNDNTWYYLYIVDYGDNRETARIEVKLVFEDNQLKSFSGSVDEPEDFYLSLDE